MNVGGSTCCRTSSAPIDPVFWTAIALPALYLPLLFNGIGSVERLALFLSLFGLHVLALIGGRRHRTGR